MTNQQDIETCGCSDVERMLDLTQCWFSLNMWNEKNMRLVDGNCRMLDFSFLVLEIFLSSTLEAHSGKRRSRQTPKKKRTSKGMEMEDDGQTSTMMKRKDSQRRPEKEKNEHQNLR